MDDARHHGRRARQFRRPGFHGGGEADLPPSRLGRAHASRHQPGLQSRPRPLRRIPDAGGIAVAGGRRGWRRERGAGLCRAQTRDARHSQGDRRDWIWRCRPCARRVHDRGADRRVSRGGAGLGDSLRGQLAVRLPAADSACALDLAQPHGPRADLRTVDGARLLDRAARARPRSARDHADPRPRRGAPGLAAHALSCRRCARRRRACRACRPDQPATIGRGDGRRRDGRFVHRAPACRLRHCLSRAARAPFALCRVAHGA